MRQPLKAIFRIYLSVVYLPPCPLFCLYPCLTGPVHLSLILRITFCLSRLSLTVTLFLSLTLSMPLFGLLSISLSIPLSLCLSLYLFVNLSVSVCLSISFYSFVSSTLLPEIETKKTMAILWSSTWNRDQEDYCYPLEFYLE